MKTFEGLLKAFEETGGEMVSATIDYWEFVLGRTIHGGYGDFCLRATPTAPFASTDAINRARRELRIPSDASTHRFQGGRLELLWSGDWPVPDTVTEHRRRLVTLPKEEEDDVGDDVNEDVERITERTTDQTRTIIEQVLSLDKELARAKAMNEAWLRLYRARKAGDKFDEKLVDDRSAEEDERLTKEYNSAYQALESMGVDLSTDEDE
jgi:hypothetical protein